MNLKLLANQVFLRTKYERSNERDVNADEKERSFPKVRMNAEMNAKNPEPIQGEHIAFSPESVPFYEDGRELDLDTVDDVNGSFEPDPSDPAIPRVLVAAWWLEEHLTEPRRVGEIFAQWTGGTQRLQRNGALRWEGGRDGTDGHWMTDLCEAREHLGIEAFIGDDGLFWWTVPERTSLDLMFVHRDVLFAQKERMKAA